MFKMIKLKALMIKLKPHKQQNPRGKNHGVLL